VFQRKRKDNKVRSKKKVRHFIIGYICTNKRKIMRKTFLADHLFAFLLLPPVELRARFVGDELPVSLFPVDFFFEDLDCFC
jgi:hypothetical protein